MKDIKRVISGAISTVKVFKECGASDLKTYHNMHEYMVNSLKLNLKNGKDSQLIYTTYFKAMEAVKSGKLKFTNDFSFIVDDVIKEVF